ncbi:DUF3159 domain-containing protein [Marinactinospora rubrisoli]|uniref:DUF3159 domain-containing protein n=1 Tax=Marinactinospora rubrisoli TaxID=2715399 RepID=A0ABW2KC47_9ACTN
MTDPSLAQDHPGETAVQAAPAKQSVLTTMMYAAVPVVVFATVVAFVSLPVAIGIAIAVALAIGVLQLLRGETVMNALGGVIGVAAAGGVSAWTGSANDFFLIGIWAALLGAVAALVSLVARRPLTGVIWNAVHGGGHAWREDRPTLLAHDLATLAVTAMFAARFGAQQWAYLADSTGWLATMDVVTGTPLTVLAGLAVFWAFRRASKRLRRTAPAPATDEV